MRKFLLLFLLLLLIAAPASGRGVGGGRSLVSTIGQVPATLNMLPWGIFNLSSDFTDVQWSLARSTITAGQIGLDGTASAAKLIATAVSGTHFIQSGSAPQTNTKTTIPYRLDVIAKPAGYSRIVVTQQNFEDDAYATSVGIDLTACATFDTSVGATATLVATSTQVLNDGWCLITIDTRYTAGGANVSLVWQPQINIDNGTGQAARSVNFAGDGTSGVLLWHFGMLPTAAWAITQKVFFDDFTNTNTIDLNDTRAPGFKWYVHNLMPNSFMSTFGWTTNPPSGPTLSSSITTPNPSSIQLLNPAASQTGYTTQLWSVADNGAGGYVGSAWKGPLVFDGLFRWPVSFSSQGNIAGTPAFWSASVEAMTGQMGGATHFTELNILEASSNTAATTLHDWSNPATPVDARFGSVVYPNNLMLPGNLTRFSSIWLNTAATGTTNGLYLFFANGQFTSFSDVTYTTTGSGSAGDTQTMPVLLDTGEAINLSPAGGWPFIIDQIQVWRNPNL